MISVQHSADRGYVRVGAMGMWKTFDPARPADPHHRGFRALESLNDISLPSATGLKLLLDEDHEVVSYVREGGVLIRNRAQGDDLLGPGCFQSASSHPSMITRVPRILSSQKTHLLMCSMRAPSGGLKPSCEHKRFSFADRHGRLRLIASGGGEEDSLRLRLDVRLYSALIEKGHHVVHELGSGRGAWFHVVAGRVRLFDQSLQSGDGAAIESEPALSFRAQEDSEILLFDLA